MTAAVTDSFGRCIDYLRISVTDRCNFRCTYCMPAEGVPLLPQRDILTFDEITRIAQLFLRMGGRKIKLTGGEPLIRTGIVDLVAALAALEGLQDLGVTTNGFHLHELAAPLRAAGLQRINVSLDSMNAARFAKLTHSLSWNRVWAGIQAAIRVGLRLKINVVTMKGITQEELAEFGRLIDEHPIEVRFIEFMPLCGTGWHPEWMVPLHTIETFFHEHYALEAIPRGSATAKTYQFKNGHGRVGFIASMTEPFCAHCSRLRLTADGQLRACLFSNTTTDLKSALRSGASDDALTAILQTTIWNKPHGHGVDPHIDSAMNLPKIRAFGG